MYLTPQHGLFVYVRGLSRPASKGKSESSSLLEIEPHVSLDSIVERGTAGTLAFPGQDDTVYSAVDELRDIFGIGRGSTDKLQIQADYKKAFHRLRVALFTDSLEAREFGEALGLHATYLIPSTDLTLALDDISSNETRNNIIRILTAIKTDSADVCLIYLTAIDQTSTVTSQQYLSWVDTLCNHLLHTDSLASRVFFTVAASPFSDTFNFNNHHLSQYSLLSNCPSTIYQQQFNISPSYSIWNDHPIHQFRSQYGVYAVFHPDSTRHDAAKVFSEKNCVEAGASGRVLPCQLLAEIAFKLGCTPKYGA